MPDPSLVRLIPDCRVSVDGKKLDIGKDAALTRVDVDLDIDLFGQCVLTFNDPKLVLINGKDFASGAAVKVELGFHTKLQEVFEGEVVALEPVFRRDTPPLLKVVCQESLHRLALSPMTRAFDQVDDKQIATKIAQEHGLTAQAPSGTKEHIVQGNVTDAVFLRRLAAKSGNTLRIEGKKLIIGPPPKGKNVDIAPGDGLRKIKVKIKANTQVGEVTVQGWDPKTKKEITAKAKPQGPMQDGAKKHGNNANLAIAGHSLMPADTASAEAMAKGRLRKIAEGFIEAQGDMIGNPDVVPGAVLNLDKLGAQIDGSYRVHHAAHAFDKHGYFVRFDAVRIGEKKKPAKKGPPAKQQPAAKTGEAKPAKQVGPQDFVLQLLDDTTGDPVRRAELDVILANGSKRRIATDGDGFIEVKDAGKGQNQVSCSLEGAAMERTLSFVGKGQRTGGASGATAPELPPIRGAPIIAKVEEHKVKTGDTLAGLAAKNNLEESALAMFNWGVSAPARINEKLHELVGCTKKTEDGANYMFDDSDQPGIVYIPKAWSERLASGQPHIMRVRRIAGRLSDLRLLYQIDPHAASAKDDTLVLEAEDGSWRHEIKVSGLSEVEPHWVELVFPSPPAGVLFNLLQDPGDGQPPLVVFKGIAYGDLG